jgi:hypothetical protein
MEDGISLVCEIEKYSWVVNKFKYHIVSSWTRRSMRGS